MTSSIHSLHTLTERVVHRGRDETKGGGVLTALSSKLVDIIDEADLKQSIRRDVYGYDATLDDLVKLRNAVAHYKVFSSYFRKRVMAFYNPNGFTYV